VDTRSKSAVRHGTVLAAQSGGSVPGLRTPSPTNDGVDVSPLHGQGRGEVCPVGQRTEKTNLMMKPVLVLFLALLLGACAARSAPQTTADDPPQAAIDRLEDLIARTNTTMEGVRRDVLEQAPARTQPRLLGAARSAETGEPVAHRGSKVSWALGVVDANFSAPTRCEISYDSEPFAAIGLVTTHTLPSMLSGPHIVRVRCCNADGCSDRDNPAAVGLLAFQYANAVPAPPSGMTIVPPDTPIADGQQGVELIQAYWFLGSGGQKLNGRQLQEVINGYDGAIPPTWGSALGYMDRLLAKVP
jgi:hypothetical protein